MNDRSPDGESSAERGGARDTVTLKRHSTPVKKTSEIADVDLVLLLSTYALEVAVGLIAIWFYKYWGRLQNLDVRHWLLLVAGVAIFSLSLRAVLGRYPERGDELHPFVFTIAANLLVVVSLAFGGEALIRAVARQNGYDLTVAGTVLKPRDWSYVRRKNAELLARTPNNISYLVSDTLLGWTTGPSRSSKDSMYLSSSEGIRSGELGIAYGARVSRRRVALVGDSFTFGLDVPFADSWASQLETQLGDKFDVLDFGVDGYGVDQAVLRFERDALPLHPAISILGFINHDLYRTMVVYPFISFPEWGFPFAKPRVSLIDGKPRTQNVPLISPREIVLTSEPGQLPFIQLEPAYKQAEWTWHWYDHSYLVRFLRSRFPRWDTETNSEDDLVRTNIALVRRFVDAARNAGSTPIVVFFPARGDFDGQDRSTAGRVIRALTDYGIHVHDLSPCLIPLGQEQAFVPGHRHYSRAGNAAVVSCLLPLLRQPPI